MKKIFGPSFIVRHQEGTHGSALQDTSGPVSTVEPDGPWKDMYRRDKYARDRVMKSARLLLPYLKDTDTVLDVGCFTQESRKYFPRAVKYIGLDAKAYHKNTKVTELHHGFAPIPCDYALCLETLEHLLDPEDTLRSLRDSLKEGGLVVISLPNETTLFHRIRCLFGQSDGQAFQGEGKHLHLPSLKQSSNFLSSQFEIVLAKYYISPSAYGSKQAWLGRILGLIPDNIHQLLADKFPSLFARGFIFLCKKRAVETSLPPDPQASQ